MIDDPTLRRVIESVARLHAMPWSRVLEAGTEQDGEPPRRGARSPSG